MRAPWWHGLDLRVLRHVRGVLRRRGLELTLVETRPSEPAAFAALAPPPIQCVATYKAKED